MRPWGFDVKDFDDDSLMKFATLRVCQFVNLGCWGFEQLRVWGSLRAWKFEGLAVNQQIIVTCCRISLFWCLVLWCVFFLQRCAPCRNLCFGHGGYRPTCVPTYMLVKPTATLFTVSSVALVFLGPLRFDLLAVAFILERVRLAIAILAHVRLARKVARRNPKKGGPSILFWYSGRLPKLDEISIIL